MSGQTQRNNALRAMQSKYSPWVADCMTALARYCALPQVDELTIEEFRGYAVDFAQWLPEPMSPNVWGVVPRIAINNGLMRDTGRYVAARSAKTHAHPVKLYAVA